MKLTAMKSTTMKLTTAQPTALQLITAFRGERSGSWLQQLLAHWLKLYSAEPLIACQRNDAGCLIFTAYDPVDRSSHTFATEEALRAWLDQRYYA